MGFNEEQSTAGQNRSRRRFDDGGLLVLWIIGMAIAFALMFAMLHQLLAGENTTDRRETPPVERAAVVDAAGETSQPPVVSARSAVVMDLASGRVLYEKQGMERVYPASTTKIMTVLLGIEYGRLDRMVTVGGEAIGVEGSSIYLMDGETISLEDLLYGALLRSGNDAATAIAMEIGETTDGFVELMNRRAAELGMEGTHFTNPTGLHEEQHYTTAYDMALLGRAAMVNPAFSVIAGTKSHTAQRQEGRDPYFYNKNKVVHQYEGGTGVKIGYTKASGRTLVASSERDGRAVICSVMDAPDWFNDAYALMNWAYDNFELTTVARGEVQLEKIPVEGGVRDTVWVGTRRDVTCLIRPEERERMGIACAVTEPIIAPVRRGDPAGQLHIYVAGEYVYSEPLYFLEDVEEVR
ncbi:MAG: D-alanyl-D-alanine carboxypeptidase [Firmicutes bacterium]|nr:D-alanyl-D-alanine carboxypeptidase [Bacillota bacterium]